MKKALICFTRVPQPGKTKTRLLGLLTAEQCAGLHWAFLRDLAGVYGALEADLYICHTPDPGWEELKSVFPAAKGFYPQAGEGLGEKMNNALNTLLARGYDAVVLTGSDLPAMGTAHLESGFEALRHADVALGPTADGGYYLVGVKAPAPYLFENQTYGTGSVFDRTAAAAEAAGRTLARALPCGDVDTPADLLALRPDPGSHTCRYLSTIGVIP